MSILLAGQLSPYKGNGVEDTDRYWLMSLILRGSLGGENLLKQFQPTIK
jgi:hypothetical protein